VEWLEEASDELREKAFKALHILQEGLLDATRRTALPENTARGYGQPSVAQRLDGALMAEKHEEWSAGRRYSTIGEFYRHSDRQRVPHKIAGFIE